MRINIKQTFTEYDGTPIDKSELNDETKQVEKKPVTLREILSNIIVGQLPNEISTAENLAKRDQLARKLYGSDEPDFSLAERTLILERLPKIYSSPRMFGLITELLDPKEEQKPTSEPTPPAA